MWSWSSRVDASSRSTMFELHLKIEFRRTKSHSIKPDARSSGRKDSRSHPESRPACQAMIHLGGCPLPTIFPDRGRIAPDIAPGFPRRHRAGLVSLFAPLGAPVAPLGCLLFQPSVRPGGAL